MAHALVDSAGRLRSGWRVALFVASFLLLLFALSFVAAVVAPADTGERAEWRGLGMLLPALLVASWLLTTRVDRSPMAAIGLPMTRWLRSIGAGGLLGGALTGSATLGLALAGWVGWTGAEGSVAAWGLAAAQLAGFLALAAFAEELLFRGYPFLSLLEGAGPVVAIGTTAIAFGLLHAFNPGVSPLAIVNISLAGVLLGVAFWRTFDLWFATGVHVGWNFVMGATDLSVSGLEMGMPAVDAVLPGPTIWTGGEFGPEGGLAVTLVTLAGIAWLSKTGRLSRRLEVIALRGPESLGPVRVSDSAVGRMA